MSIVGALLVVIPAIFELLNQMVSDIMARMKETSPKTREAAWRMAVETWLQKQGHITVSVNGNVLPYSFRLLRHNLMGVTTPISSC